MYHYRSVADKNLQKEKSNALYIKNIYPVPARDVIYVEVNVPSESRVTFEIKDVTGKSVLLKQIEHFNNERVELSTGEFAKGIYLLTVSSDSLEETRRIEIY